VEEKRGTGSMMAAGGVTRRVIHAGNDDNGGASGVCEAGAG